MGASKKTISHAPDRIAQLTAQVEALTARLAAIEGTALPSTNGNGGHTEPQSRRDLLKLAGAAAAGAAGTILLRSTPAAALTGDPLTLGTSVGNDANSTTDVSPTAASAPSPLFQATGQGVAATTTVAPTASTSPPLLQSIPLIGAIGAGGALPQVGNPPTPDYPGFAPIQGIGGVTTIVVSGQNVQYSEGVNGYGAGATGIGVTGESDVGYGIAGGSGGIDIAALGSGRFLQLPLVDSLLSSPPAGPPNYTANDFEIVRDGNGVIWVSKAGGGWRRLNSSIPVTPFRLYDNRPAGKPANSNTDIQIAGVGTIPADAVGVFGNLVAIAPAKDGFLTIYPKGGVLTPVTSLNFIHGATMSGFFMVGLGSGGKVTVFVSGNGAVAYTLDVAGYLI
jgi:hypothetical protein